MSKLQLYWDTLDSQTKEEILFRACVQERFQHYEWDEIDGWLQHQIVDSLEARSHRTVTLVA